MLYKCSIFDGLLYPISA